MKPTAMTTADTTALTELARPRSEPVISILLPPTPPGEARIVLRNLAKEAERRLVALGERPSDARARIAKAEELLDDHDLWLRPLIDVGLYVDSDAPVRLRGPELGGPLVSVGPRFQLKHLLDCVPHSDFAVLALSRKTTHLYMGQEAGLTEVRASGFPMSMDDVLRYDDREPQLQSHSSARRGVGGVVAAFHGQGGKREQGEDLLRYLRSVDAGVSAMLGDELLVLAGTDEVTAAFRRVTANHNVAVGEVSGSVERLAVHDLAAAASPIAEASFSVVRDEVQRRVADLDAGGRSGGDAAEILAAAVDGRVEAVLVAGDAEMWGTFDMEQRTTDMAGNDAPDDLLNVAAVETWRHGGSVYVVPSDQIPGAVPMAALFRY